MDIIENYFYGVKPIVRYDVNDKNARDDLIIERGFHLCSQYPYFTECFI